MDLVKLSKRFAKFLGDEDLSLNDVYTHLTSDVFTMQITRNLSGNDIIKLVFLTKAVLEGKDPVRLNEILEQNLFLFSIVEFLGEPEIECNYCGGSGDVECSYCGGDGSIRCDTCDGLSQETCPECDGSGEFDDDGTLTDCDTCDGRGSIDCNDCGGDGENSCNECNGDGNNKCDECDGLGVTKHSGANYEIDSYASYNPILKNIIEKTYNQNIEINLEDIERTQTFIFNRVDVTDSDENTEIDSNFNYQIFVNRIITDPYEFELSVSSISNTIKLFDDDLTYINKKFME